MSEIIIREYRDEDKSEWLRVHAIIMSISHAWNLVIQERPTYEGHQCTRLVAICDGKIVGLTDVQYENYPGELCWNKDSPGGYVLEFGRLPEYSGRNIGKMLIDATIEDALKKGFHRLEYWSQDRKAQRFYRRLGMKEIGRYYRFYFKPDKDLLNFFMEKGVAIEWLYAGCMPEDWPNIQQSLDIIHKHPQEPHLCVGFEIRF